ncbi:MAG: hypothetical protein ACYDHH_01670 [Solirubrobacteraceae bacterium]
MRKVGTRIRARPTAVGLAVLLLCLPQTALAGSIGLSPGVHVDPGSPTAKEYAIPLGAARGNGSPGLPSTGPLFGQGITHADTASSATGSSSAASSSSQTGHASTSSHRHRVGKRSHRRPRRHRLSGGTAASRHVPPPPQNVIGTNSNSSTGITWMLGAAVLVLLLGGIGGAALARRGRRSDPDPYPS